MKDHTPEYKVMRYASLARLIEQANSWNAAHPRKLTTFVKRFEDGGIAVSCGNMGWRGHVDAGAKFDGWLSDQAAIEVEGIVSQTELFEED